MFAETVGGSSLRPVKEWRGSLLPWSLWSCTLLVEKHSLLKNSVLRGLAAPHSLLTRDTTTFNDNDVLIR